MNASMRSSRFGLWQQGITLISAIFLLLLMSVLAAAMVRFVSGSHRSMAADIEGSRAYQAARAGIEWGLYQLDPNDQQSTVTAISCPATNPASLTAIPGFTVSVACEVFPASGSYSESSRSIRIFRLTATATSTAVSAPGVERQVVVVAEKCRDSSAGGPPYGC